MNNTFTYKNQNGEETTYEILFKFTNPETNINYLVYTDNKEDVNNNINLLTSRYTLIDDILEIIPIEEEKEFDFVDKMLEKVGR